MRVKKGVAISDPQVGRKGTAGDDGAVTARALDRGQRCDPRHSNRHGTRSSCGAFYADQTPVDNATVLACEVEVTCAPVEVRDANKLNRTISSSANRCACAQSNCT